MTDQEICDLYDSSPDLSIAKLARMTGKSIAKLKAILMGEVL